MMEIILQTWGQELGVDVESTDAIVLFILYAALMIGIGLWAGRFQSDEEDYYVAGRSIGSWVTALSIFAGAVSGWGFIANPGAVYAGGIDLFLVGLVTPIGMILGYWLLAKKMRVLGIVKNAITAPDAIYFRYKDNRLRLLAIIAIIAGTIGFLAAQYAALGIILGAILPVGFLGAVLIGVAVIAIYTIVGGMLAAVWSDSIQGFLMIVASIVALIYIVMGVPGGLVGSLSTIQDQSPELLNSTLLGGNGALPIGLVISLFMISLLVGAQPHFFTKFYMTESTETMRWGGLIAGSAAIIISGLPLIGLMAKSAELQNVIQIQNPDVAMPLALFTFAPPFITAFILVGAAAAIMSTSNAMLNIAAATITHDFFQRYLGQELSDSEEVFYARITTGVVLFGSLVLAATSSGLILVLGAAGLGIFLTVFVPSVLIGYNWKGMTAEGALVGGGIGLVFIFITSTLSQFYNFQLPFGFVPAEAATIISIILSVLVSILTSTNNYTDLRDEDMKLVLDIPNVDSISDTSHKINEKSDD